MFMAIWERVVKRDDLTLEKSTLFCLKGCEGMTKIQPGREFWKRRDLIKLNEKGMRVLAETDELDYVKFINYLARSTRSK